MLLCKKTWIDPKSHLMWRILRLLTKQQKETINVRQEPQLLNSPLCNRLTFFYLFGCEASFSILHDCQKSLGDRYISPATGANQQLWRKCEIFQGTIFELGKQILWLTKTVDLQKQAENFPQTMKFAEKSPQQQNEKDHMTMSSQGWGS